MLTMKDDKVECPRDHILISYEVCYPPADESEEFGFNHDGYYDCTYCHGFTDGGMYCGWPESECAERDRKAGVGS